jgi:hypothetical protein
VIWSRWRERSGRRVGTNWKICLVEPFIVCGHSFVGAIAYELNFHMRDFPTSFKCLRCELNRGDPPSRVFIGEITVQCFGSTTVTVVSAVRFEVRMIVALILIFEGFGIFGGAV